MISDEEIQDFFKGKIFDLDEGDVNIFFEKCDRPTYRSKIRSLIGNYYAARYFITII
ncbi:MAG: hypothetical protein MUD14_25985 [Hydrococcus sp. Prado102]|jgi:hypothetical protein|nr:hypothetical protein [Hydrococcus sp. Prado102]